MQPGRQTSEPRRCSGSRREITQRRAFPLPLLLLGSQRLEFLSCRFGQGRSRHDGKCRPGRLTSGWPHHARAAATVKGAGWRKEPRRPQQEPENPKYRFQHTQDSMNSKSHMMFGLRLSSKKS